MNSSNEKVDAITASDSRTKFHLDNEIQDDGTNLSLGEKQLLSLARAALRNTKVLVLDEATSNLDFLTDRNIQRAIATEFNNSTILCIAHRIRTIISYDRIMVMDYGKLIEFDTPLNLYDKGGMFTSLCTATSISRMDIESSCRS